VGHVTGLEKFTNPLQVALGSINSPGQYLDPAFREKSLERCRGDNKALRNVTAIAAQPGQASPFTACPGFLLG